MAADYYGTVAASKVYFSDRGNAVWPQNGAQDAKLLSCLIIASEWIDRTYKTAFINNGYKTGQRAQVREWPRSGAIDIDGYAVAATVPIEIEQATYEAALREFTTSGALSVDITPSEIIDSVSISGALSINYRGINSVMDTQLKIPAIDKILAPLIISSGASKISTTSIRV